MPPHPSLPAARLIRRLALAGVLLGCVVVVLGAYVRLTDAGLGCPDWPGCYGHLTPLGAAHEAASSLASTPLDVGKAWREMIHRYAASTLGLIIVVITALAIAMRRERLVRVPYTLALLTLVVLQGALGMLTVTWRLTPLIVTLHLLFGLTTVSLLFWLWLSLRVRAPLVAHSFTPAERTARRLATLAVVVLAAQIALGGWTSSNYAAIACPDLPTCQGSWWPTMDFRDAFELWRAPSVNYAGGVLGSTSRVAIHFTHRLGALVTTLVLLVACSAVRRRRSLVYAGRAACGVLLALALQLTIGLTMVHFAFPLPLATAHNAGALLTLLAVLTMRHRLGELEVGPELAAPAARALGATGAS
jgi:cytochrome c oxidase assembly protein subunit 15